jgi:hypothetical protein
MSLTESRRSLPHAMARLDKAYQAFFRRVQWGENAGFPAASH